MQCSSCGSVAPHGKRFCADCGAPLPQLCSACGAESPAGKRFCADCGASLTSGNSVEGGATPLSLAKPNPASPEDGQAPRHDAERRQITVLFCDLVGSTALSTQLDPEDFRDVIRAFHRCAEDVIRRHDGFVAKYMGDGLLAYFGYPHAFEDDAEQAVRAGLTLIEEIGAIAIPEGTLQARVGIATGLVVVGDLIGSGHSQEWAIVGETPNLAARLQALAAPGTVVISSKTRQLTRDVFTYIDLGGRAMKGFSQPVQAWRVVGESAIESRFEALRPGQTPLVGRDDELDVLTRRWAQAKAGDGRVVLISGESGIGKSRLSAALLERLQSEPHIRLRYFCSPHGSDSALRPVINRLERAARWRSNDSPTAKREKLRTLLAPGVPTAEEEAIFAALLSVADSDDESQIASLTPQKRKERTLLALARQLEALAQRRPILMLWEDVHWIDPTSLQLLDGLIARASALPVLIIVTFRPEFAAPWVELAHATTLTLNRLNRNQNIALVKSLTGEKLLPPELQDQILAHADGVPLFIEELTNTILESGVVREEAGKFDLSGPLPPLAVPATLQASLLARLDRLAPVKEIAQIGASIGREFSFDIVAAVSGRPVPELLSALQQLEASGLVTRRGVPPEAIYAFKHALLQEAAHDSLLRSRRRLLHARIAAVLEEQTDLSLTQPEAVARHFDEAGLWAKAGAYWSKAASQALNRSANREARGHLGRGLSAVSRLPSGPEQTDVELDLHLGLASASIAAAGYAAAETEAAYLRARELLLESDTDPRQFAVLYGLFVVRWNHARLGSALEIAEDLLTRAEQLDDPVAVCVGLRSLAVAENAMARFDQALVHATHAVQVYETIGRGGSAVQYGHDIGVAALTHQGLAQGFLGHHDQAAESFQRALAQARDVGHANTIGYAEMWAAFMQLSLRDMSGAAERAQHLIEFSEEQGMAFWAALGRCILGGALQAQGEPSRGLQLLDQGLSALDQGRVRIFRPPFLCLRAEALAALGRIPDARRTLTEGLREMSASHERWWEKTLMDVSVRCSGHVPSAQEAHE